MRLKNWALFVPVVSGAISCGQKTSSVAAVVSQLGQGCSTSIIDQGQKGSATTVARGTHSDSRTMPGTNWPATAFTDANALAIKLAYWNGVSYVTEAISGDGGGTFVRLSFLSSGVPVVTWAMGVNVKAAIRSAALGNDGTWQAGIVDVASAPRALEIAVNPLDQIVLTYLTDTATTGRAKFLYCDAPCTSTAGFQTMGTNPWLENTNVVAAQNATGAGWCKASASTYYPVAAYSTSAGTKYAVCMNTLGNCLNGTNWTTTLVAAASTTSNKVLLDANIVGDVAKVVTNGSSGMVPYRMGTTTCTSVPSAFTAGAVIGSSSSGNLWISGAKDASGRFHVVANEGTTSVRYYNTSGTDFIGSWNPAGVVDTVALPAASTGGAAINAATGGIFSSYGINAIPYDIKFGYVNDYSMASNGAAFTRSAADLTGDLQLSTAGAQLRQIAAASTPSARPAVAYVDFSSGSTAGARLKYAYRTGDTAASAWDVTVIPNTINPQSPALRFDANGLPWLSYFDASSNRFYVATNSRADGTGNWFTYEFPAVPSGAPVALPAANNTALASYVHDGRSDLVMAAIDNNATSKGVRLSIFNTATRGFSAPIVIDGLTAGAAGAANVSLDTDANGALAIAYQDLSIGRVRYAASVNGGATWSSPLNVSGVSQGAGASLKINRADGTPGLSYFDQANNAVYFMHCSGSIASCATGGWSPTTVEGAAGVSGLATASSQLLTTSLLYREGIPAVVYPRGQGNDGNAMIGVVNSTGLSGLIAARGSNGALAGSPALNFGIAGWGIATSRNAVGGITGAYLGPGNWLYSLSCGD